MSDSSTGATTSGGPGTTQGTTRNRPADPLMGSTEETYANSNTFYYAFGGKPRHDWSGLENRYDRLLSDLCFRSLDPIAGQKSAVLRTKGLTERFEKSHKLTDFQKSIWNHMEKYGLDTITYLPDPKNNLEVQSVVTHHARFTGDLQKAVTTSKQIQQSFDKWDRKHDYEAREFLLESLSKEIRNSFETFHDQTDTFASTWLKLVHHLVTTTAKTYDSMKEKVRNIRPQQYSGQNIEEMATDIIRLSEQLDNARHFDHSLTLNMVDAFLCATPDAKGTFHHELNNLRSQVSKKRQEFLFLSKVDQDIAFAGAKLTYRDVCLIAIREYKDLHSIDMWEPSKLPKDRHAPSANLTSAHILQLIESVASKNDSSSTSRKPNFKNSGSTKKGCFNCGSTDHQIKDCPKPKPNDQQARNNRHSNMSKWKLTAPKSGEPTTKNVNGRAFNWCAKCGNWTTTHSTATHTGKSNDSNNRKSTSTAETNLTAWTPSAWIVEKPPASQRNVLPWCGYAMHVMVTIWLVITNLDTTQLQLPPNLSSLFSINIPILHVATISLAPILWFTLGFITCFMTKFIVPFNPITDTTKINQKQEKFLQRQTNKALKVRNFKSAKNRNLIPNYPLRLRQKGIFHHRNDTPTLEQRNFNTLLDDHLANLHRQHDTPCPCTHLHNCIPSPHKSHRKGNLNVDKAFIDLNSTCRPFDWDSSYQHTRPSVPAYKNKKGQAT